MVKFDVKVNQFRDKETGEFVTGRMFRNIFHAAAAISRTAKRLIKTSPEASAPGRPPHTRRGLLRGAIRFDADRKTNSAVIGPMFSRVGGSAAAHEHGGRYKGDYYEKRPVMEPALERNVHRFAGQFSGSLGG